VTGVQFELNFLDTCTNWFCTNASAKWGV